MSLKKFYSEAEQAMGTIKFNKKFRTEKEAEPTLRLMKISPVCKECADYVQV